MSSETNSINALRKLRISRRIRLDDARKICKAIGNNDYLRQQMLLMTSYISGCHYPTNDINNGGNYEKKLLHERMTLLENLKSEISGRKRVNHLLFGKRVASLRRRLYSITNEFSKNN